MGTFIVNTIKGHTANAKLTVDDTLEVTEISNLNGGIAVDTSAFTVADATGDVHTDGILDVDGAATLNTTLGVTGLSTLTGGVSTAAITATGLADLNGGIAVDTSNFTVSGTTGAVHTASDITVDGTVDGRDVAADGTKLDGIEALADVTDFDNVSAALAAATGAVAFNSQNITTIGTVDGRDIATDGTKLDGIEALADVTDFTNVNAALAAANATIDINSEDLSGVGDVTLDATKGITFGSGTKLDDYEEGTFTPALSNIGSGTYAAQVGFYTKIGNQVMCEIQVSMATLGTASGDVSITGLPFTTTAASGYQATGGALRAMSFAVNRLNMYASLASGPQRIAIRYDSGTTSGSESTLQHSDLGGTGTVIFNFSYKTDL